MAKEIVKAREKERDREKDREKDRGSREEAPPGTMMVGAWT